MPRRPARSDKGGRTMKSIVLYLLGVPVLIIIALNIFGVL
jgi:uncharacterized protein involved in outer membrane biogenesis